MRGVAVQHHPAREEQPELVQWACTAQLWQVLQRGCRVWLTPPPFDHTKLMVVDGAWSLIGSANWDPRSLRLNFEFNVECYDRDLAGAALRAGARKEDPSAARSRSPRSTAAPSGVASATASAGWPCRTCRSRRHLAPRDAMGIFGEET